MLVSLSIGNVVLIESIDLTFGSGLCVLTGETGAGKSILLDSLGLALGMRASANLVRGANDGLSAVVNATFIPDTAGKCFDLMTTHGLNIPEVGEPVILRRSVDAAGKSRAFVNDQPISASLLRQLGNALVEIESQFATQGLMDNSSHMDALDDFAGLDELLTKVGALYNAYKEAQAALNEATVLTTKVQEEEKFLRHAVDELSSLDPLPHEESQLAEKRAFLMHGEKLIEAMDTADKTLTSGEGVESQISTAIRLLDRHTDASQGRFKPILEALERTQEGIVETLTLLGRAMADAEPDPQKLEDCEERLFALRAAARKYNVPVAELTQLGFQLEKQLSSVKDNETALQNKKEDRERAKANYVEGAKELSRKRKKAARELDKAVAIELPPLRLEKAKFTTLFEKRTEAEWGPKGIDQVRFEVSTVPGMPCGPLGRIASGGELARFLLALKVVLHQANAVETLVFDEVDSGVGGAIASAVGERLARLAKNAQVLVITHSPQVAAFGAHHLRVAKKDDGKKIITIVEDLDVSDRREEIARMLAGAEITEEARAAADSLLDERHR